MVDRKGPIRCPRCKEPLTAGPGDWVTAYTYDDCLRRCDSCGVGYSNARHNPTTVFRNPLVNLSLQVRDGVDKALERSLNVKSRTTKRRRLGFSTSEDALTWTVFAWLARDARNVLTGLGSRLFGFKGTHEPTVLLWGVPVPPDSRGDDIRHHLVKILDALGEDPGSRSEPDVIIDYGSSGLVFVEVKWRAPNDVLATSRRSKFDRYVNDSPSVVAPELVKDSGLYELARNWRIGWELSGGRPFRLVNLGLESLFTRDGLDEFTRALSRDSDVRFRTLTWNDFLRDMNKEPGGMPPWLRDWLQERGVQWG